MRARRLLWIGGALLAVLLLLGGISIARRELMFDTDRAQSVALQMCSCVFISGRPEADCRSDFPNDSLVGLDVSIIDGAIRATGAGGEAEALYSKQTGCRPATEQ